MTFHRLSPKQKQIFRWPYTGKYKALICDGAVRSGKTVCMIASFILWAMRTFGDANFGICGKTVRSAERNIIQPLMGIVDITSIFRLRYNRSIGLLTVEGCGQKNYFYVFGGKDESSYMLIQGITLSGVLFDEVALMPRSFVEQAITRTLSVKDSLYWFNCNPANQFHWFYEEWVCKPEEHRALHLHFLMSDNPTLTKEQLEEADRSFKGVFHDRYIKGLWVSAEGVIYREFAENSARFLLDEEPNDIIYAVIGMDFGGNGSAHAAVCTGFSLKYQNMVALDEYYRKEIISPTELENDICNFIVRCQNKYKIADIYCDSAETTLLRGIRVEVAKRHIPINVNPARKSEIIGRIRFTDMMMSQGRFYIMTRCIHLTKALQTAVWDSRYKTEDVRLDDGNYNIDSLDAMEYSFEHNMKDMIDRK